MAKKKESYSQRAKEKMLAIIDKIDLSELQKEYLKNRWLDQLSWLSNKASSAQKWYYRLRLTTIVGGVIIPALVGFNISDGRIRQALVFSTFALSQVVAISAAVEEFFHYGERWTTHRTTSEELKSEGWQFFQLSGHYYKAKTHAQAFSAFSTRVEMIIQKDLQGFTEALKDDDKKKAEDQEDDKRATPIAPGMASVAGSGFAPTVPGTPIAAAPPRSAPPMPNGGAMGARSRSAAMPPRDASAATTTTSEENV